MNDKWAIMHCSTVRPLKDLPDWAFDELKKTIKEEEGRRDTAKQDRAQELQEQIVKLMRQIEDEGFWVMCYDDKLDPSNIWIQC